MMQNAQRSQRGLNTYKHTKKRYGKNPYLFFVYKKNIVITHVVNIF